MWQGGGANSGGGGATDASIGPRALETLGTPLVGPTTAGLPNQRPSQHKVNDKKVNNFQQAKFIIYPVYKNIY